MTICVQVRRRAAGVSGVAVACILTAGCATWSMPSDTSDAPLRRRAITDSNKGVGLSAAILSRDDDIRMLGANLEAAGVQAVWVEVRNNSTQTLWLLRSGTDPDYFSPLEVAWLLHVNLGGSTNEKIDEHFDQLAFRSPIPPGETRSGILFTNPQPVTKLLNVDLLGDRTLISFTLFVPSPGAEGGYEKKIHMYPDSEVKHCEDLESLRRAIEALPCCTASATGATEGEPLNVVLVGRLHDIGAALVRRGYRRDPEGSEGEPDLFGRAPDLVVRKHAQAGSSGAWLRLWRAPLDFRGQTVFVVQAGRPIGGRFVNPVSEQPLHPDVDEVRNILIQDFLYSGGLAQLGFATGVGAASLEQPRKLAGNEHYYTDGLRAVLFFASRPLTFAEVHLLDWESLPLGTEVLKETHSAQH
jgi:hypothetical protein